LQALDGKAYDLISRDAGLRDLNRAATAALDHTSRCELCQQREAIRKSAGPPSGALFPGEEHDGKLAALLWYIPILVVSWFAARLMGVEGMDDPRASWLIGLMAVGVAWLGHLSPATYTGRSASYACLPCGVVALAWTDFEVLLWRGGLPVFIVPATIAAFLLYLRFGWRG